MPLASRLNEAGWQNVKKGIMPTNGYTKDGVNITVFDEVVRGFNGYRFISGGINCVIFREKLSDCLTIVEHVQGLTSLPINYVIKE